MDAKYIIFYTLPSHKILIYYYMYSSTLLKLTHESIGALQTSKLATSLFFFQITEALDHFNHENYFDNQCD